MTRFYSNLRDGRALLLTQTEDGQMEYSFGEKRRSSPAQFEGLRVRPDQARIDVTLSAEAETAGHALAALGPVARRLETALAASPTAVLKPVSFDVPHQPGKLSHIPARLHYRIAITLPTEATFGERAQRIAALDDILQAQRIDAKKQRPTVDFERSVPSYRLAEPETLRPMLVQRLLERARAVAPTGTSDVRLTELVVDCDVEQHGDDLEEVVVSLNLGGRVELSLPVGS